MWNYVQLMCVQTTEIIKPVWLYTRFLVAWRPPVAMDTDYNFYYLIIFRDYTGDSIMQVFTSDNSS